MSTYKRSLTLTNVIKAWREIQSKMTYANCLN